MIRLVFILFLFLWSPVFGQTVRILFDASKAETAGNADWIIDADLYNLGFNNGPAVPGLGDEANPAVIPTPAQSAITSLTPETYWDGGLSYWGIDCVNRGYHVETLPYNGQITYGSLSNLRDLSYYKIFIVCEPNILFTASEKTAILNFVNDGGSLYMISDHDVSDRNGDGYDSPFIWNDLMSNNTFHNQPFGITFDLQNFSQTSTNIANLPGDSLLHGPFGNVAEVQWSSGTTMTLDTAQNASVKGVVYKLGSSTTGFINVLCARARFGHGKVAAIGDSSPFDDGTGDPNDVLYNGYTLDANGNHRKLIMNTTIWLAAFDSLNTSLTDFQQEISSLIIWPVPASQEITASFYLREQNFVQISIMDICGKNLLEYHKGNPPAGQFTQDLDISGLSNGIYFLVLKGNDGTITRRFIKN